MKIAHLSDLHLAVASPRSTVRNTRRLLEHLHRSGVDHIVVTGDITAHATPEELALARAIFASYGLLHPDRLTVIPGNHDVFGGVRSAEDLLEFPARCRTTDHQARLAAFTEAFAETFQGVVWAREGGATPFVKTVGSVALIGIDSVARYSRLRNPLGSNGAVAPEEAAALNGIVTSGILRGKHRVVLLHHHFRKPATASGGALAGVWDVVEGHTMKLRGKKALLRLFRLHDVDLVLHGHYHENSGYVRGGVRFLNGGGSVLGPDVRELSLNLLAVSRGGIRVDIQTIPAATPASRSVLRPVFPAPVPSHAAAA